MDISAKPRELNKVNTKLVVETQEIHSMVALLKDNQYDTLSLRDL